MSKSRLEKFLYALYSLDSSDLPNPLSRIEELYKCLVTGDEAPIFEPLSRVEKYLMAILGIYDVDELPNPISRVEVLLYKLATGDDNLDDVKSFLSEHEELLAEIIRNGGVGGNIDIEYVLYTLSTEFNTLYNTAKKPVKSAILKGNTMNNLLCDYSIYESTVKMNHKNIVGKVLIKNMCKGERCFFKRLETTTGVYKGATLITSNNFIYEVPEGQHITTIYDDEGVITASELLENAMIIKYQEGMENWDIPYFEGMKSVQMPVLTTTGKNLFPTNNFIECGTDNRMIGQYIYEVYLKSGNYRGSFVHADDSDKDTWLRYEMLDEQDNQVLVLGAVDRRFTIENNGLYKLKFSRASSFNNTYTKVKVQIEEGSVATEYEPYKSNILTVNEDIKLCGIGDIRDELDCLTGKVTKRISEIVLNGSENWIQHADKLYTKVFKLTVDDIKDIPHQIICDSLPTNADGDVEKIANTLTDIYLALSTSKANNLAEFKAYLSNNPMIVQYPLKTESDKTVDLSVVDQYGNNTKLSTFNDITHVTLSSEGLIPEAELEVATKNEEDLEDSIVYTAYTLSEEFNTLYNTAKKPVKSAILSGQTLVNIKGNQVTIGMVGRQVEYLVPTVKPNTRYLITYDLESTSGFVAIGFLKNTSTWSNNLEEQGLKGQFILNSGDEPNYFRIGGLPNTVTTVKGLNIIEYQEGMENWDIPYFEGMKSVQMPVLHTRNNLFNGKMEQGGYFTVTGEPMVYIDRVRCIDFIRINNPNNVVMEIINSQRNDDLWILQYDINKNYLGKNLSFNIPMGVSKQKLNLNSNCAFIKFYENSVHSSYLEKIKYIISDKTNILTVNEDVTLRGIGDVQDELDCLTGEVVKHVGEVVLDGNESYTYSIYNQSTTSATYRITIVNQYKANTKYLCNKLPSKTSTALIGSNSIYLSRTDNSKNIYIELLSNITGGISIELLKEYLKSNPIIINFEQFEKSVKTVDLSVVDQDGNDAKLSTFNDITHVTLSSEGLVPEAELEVAEKVPEVAASMLTISREQEVINATTNEQSENVDATMIATTEIYEGLL